MFCTHQWKLLSEVVTESKFEHAMKYMASRSGSIKLPWQMADANRKHIQTFACDKCGKLKRFVENI